MFQFRPAAFVIFICCLSGCRMGVPIHVWQAPKMESAVGKKIAVPRIEGPDAIARSVHEKMITLAPSDVGRGLAVVDPNQVVASEDSKVRLVSGVEELSGGKSQTDVNTSDLMMATVARREGFDYVMRGRVLARNQGDVDASGSGAIDPDQPLAISWRLFSVPDDRHAGGSPVVTDLKTARETYPELAMIADPAEALATAAVREAYRLVTPSIMRDRIQLAIPYVLPGSKEVRRGNALAMAGRWGEAEAVWQATSEKHPTQVAALHNLAIAAAAGQDFSRAKQLARKAIRRNPARLHQSTLVWIERRQREYHRAFNLPDPPEGWFVTSE